MLAALLAVLASDELALTRALFEMVPLSCGRTTIVTVALAPFPRVPNAQATAVVLRLTLDPMSVTVVGVALQLPCEADDDT
jgi:hypothetical protein